MDGDEVLGGPGLRRPRGEGCAWAVRIKRYWPATEVLAIEFRNPDAAARFVDANIGRVVDA